MEHLKIEGRHLGEGYAATQAFPDRIEVRVDSHTNPEFWFQMTVPGPLVCEWLMMMMAQRTDVMPGENSTLETLKAQLARAILSG